MRLLILKMRANSFCNRAESKAVPLEIIRFGFQFKCLHKYVATTSAGLEIEIIKPSKPDFLIRGITSFKTSTVSPRLSKRS